MARTRAWRAERYAGLHQSIHSELRTTHLIEARNRLDQQGFTQERDLVEQAILSLSIVDLGPRLAAKLPVFNGWGSVHKQLQSHSSPEAALYDSPPDATTTAVSHMNQTTKHRLRARAEHSLKQQHRGAGVGCVA